MSDNGLLVVSNISLAFGGLKAVDDFSLTLNKGDLQGLIGPNGAGKTTVFNLLTGVYRPDRGTITLAGKSMCRCRPSTIASCGMARTFQNIRLFPELSVIDNVRVACRLRVKHGIVGVLLRTRRHRIEEAATRTRAMDLLRVFNLQSRAHEPANCLPYGDQRRLEIARALATEPKVLLLDEPAAGMNPQEKKELAGLIQQVREQFKVTILLIEHDMGLVMEICERITVLDHGQTIAVGTPERNSAKPPGD